MKFLKNSQNLSESMFFIGRTHEDRALLAGEGDHQSVNTFYYFFR